MMTRLSSRLSNDQPLGEVTKNVGTLFLRNRERFGKAPAFAERVLDHGERGELGGRYRTWTWEKLVGDMLKVAVYFESKGLKIGDRIAFITSNSYSRLVSEMAAMSSGLVSVPIFAGYAPDLMSELIKFSDVKLVVRGDDLSLERVPECNAESAKRIMSIWGGVKPSDLALVMYTSGTSSFPKGVELTHSNLMSQQRALEILWKPQPGMRFLCYLPWHHSFGGLFERFFALHSGGCLAIDDSWGKDVDRLFRNFAEIKPNVYFSVPKVYQEIVARVLTSKEAERIFFNPELKFVFTAAAPLPMSTSVVFKSKGVPVIEGWGLTETSPCCTLTPLSLERQMGVVGFPIPGVEVKLGDENEILVRGMNVMRGYFRQPEATQAVLDSEGWFKTGDVGEITAGGLKIVSRKDRMFKLSNGEKVFPAVIEENVKGVCKFIKHAFIFGRGHTHPFLLVFPNAELLSAGCSFSQTEDGTNCKNPTHSRLFARCLGECLDRINKNSKAKFEKIQKALIIERELTLDANELTPSFKLIPRKIEENYGEYIRAMEEQRYDALPKDAYVVDIGGA